MILFRPTSVLLVLALAAGAGCGRGGPDDGKKAPEGAKAPEPTELVGHYKGIDFFQGDTVRIAPHLGFTAAHAFTLKLEGKSRTETEILPFKHFHLRMDIYLDGKLLPGRSPAIGVFSVNNSKAESEFEVTFSLKEVEEAGESKYVVKYSALGSTATGHMPRHKLKTEEGSTEVHLRTPQALREGESLPIWAMYRGTGAWRRSHDDKLEETARKADCAYVLVLTLEDFEPLK
jgi:hypothetical protein